MVRDLVRVCQDWFPIGSYKGQKAAGFWMDIKLKTQMDILIKNVIYDWDFTIIITGGGEVRVGKSVLALQISIYWTYQMEKVHGIKVPFTLKENVVFQWNRLIEIGNRLGKKSKFCVLQYDEAGETMEGTKSATMELRAVRDYLRECGQYDFLNILVMPEFFDLPKGIAITRSTFLIDVYYTATKEGLFQRGYFKFYSRRQKKKLYLNGKKELNYNAAPYNFNGEFRNFYPVNEKEYRELKQKALQEREQNTKNKMMLMRDALILYLVKEHNMKQKEIRDVLFKYCSIYLTQQAVSRVIDQAKMRLETKTNHNL